MNIQAKEGLMGVYDGDNLYTNDTVSLCVPWYLLKDVKIKDEKITDEMINNSKNVNLKYCLAFVNSKVLNFYFKQLLSSSLHVYPEAIRNLPIKVIPESEQQTLIDLVDKMLTLKNELSDAGGIQTDRTSQLENEIIEVDDEINKNVYNLFGITNEEIKIIEKSFEN